MKRIQLLCLLLIGAAMGLQAQQAKLDKANRLYNKLAFHSASKLYADLAENHPDVFVFGRLADCYRLTERFVEAEEWYARTVRMNGVEPINFLYYGEALMANEKYEEAVSWLHLYEQRKPEDARVKNLLAACEEIANLEVADFPCEIFNLPINTARSEFGPAFYEDKLLFCSDRDTIMGIQHTDGWKGTAFLDLYAYEEGSAPKKLRGEINSRYHEGPAVVATDGRIYLTRSNFSGTGPIDQTGRKSDGLDKLKLFSAVQGNGKWQIDGSPVFSFNSDDYSVAHPSFDANNLKLYFASDMPGGYGGVDIYVAELQAGEIWGKPVNLGPAVNTPGDEMYPFIHEDGTLYFASDGHKGHGALDIFQTKESATGEWSAPLNMGRPLNSSRDDFGLILDAGRATGYVVSNRIGGRGKDDIYRVNGTGVKLIGEVYDDYTGEKIPGATIRLREDGKVKSTAKTNQDGIYNTGVSAYRTYDLIVERPGYKMKTLMVKTGEVSYPDSIIVNVSLEDTLLIALAGRVYNKDGKSAIDGAVVSVYNKCTNTNQPVEVDEQGGFSMRLEPNCTYYFSGTFDGFMEDNDVISTTGITSSTELTTALELVELKEDLVIELKNIYYDFGAHSIREDAVADLDKLGKLMQQYPSLKIELSSHTDSRGSEKYNRELSQKRAQSCVDYLSGLGIPKGRLMPKGYGETALKNGCAEGVECSEEEHQVNRRTEFRVLAFDKEAYRGDQARISVNQKKPATNPEDKFEQKVNEQQLVVLTDQGNDPPKADPAPKRETTPIVEQPKNAPAERKEITERERISAPAPAKEVKKDEPKEVVSTPGEWWESGFAYAVQLSGNGELKDFKDYAEFGRLYKSGDAVVLGYYKKYSEAATVVYQVGKKGLEKTFVVTYKDGKRSN